MNRLEDIAGKLRIHRWRIVLLVLSGMTITAAAMILVPSQLGFVLAGPLVCFPWALLCAAFAHRPSRSSLVFLVVFAIAGLAWPLLFLPAATRSHADAASGLRKDMRP